MPVVCHMSYGSIAYLETVQRSLLCIGNQKSSQEVTVLFFSSKLTKAPHFLVEKSGQEILKYGLDVRFLNTYGINGLNNQTRHDDKR